MVTLPKLKAVIAGNAMQVDCALRLYLPADILLLNWTPLQALALQSKQHQPEEALRILSAGRIHAKYAGATFSSSLDCILLRVLRRRRSTGCWPEIKQSRHKLAQHFNTEC